MRAITHHQKPTNRSIARTSLRRQGFTLIELLVVMALMSVLLTLIFKPLLDTFNLTSRAGTQIEAQETGRELVRQVATTLSDSVFIYDNAQTPINIWVPNKAGSQVPILTNYAMVEYVRPARQLDQKNSNPTDPTSGDPIYPATAKNGETGFALPLTRGRTLGRIFIGLANNTATDSTVAGQNGMPKFPYANKYDNDPRADNRYTLYKAEVQTFIKDPNDSTRFIPNLQLFHSIDRTGATVDTGISGGFTTSVKLYDENFFYDNTLAGGNETGAGDPKTWGVPGAKSSRADGLISIADNWRAVSTTLLLPKKVDAIALDRDTNTNAINFDATTGEPTMHPLITFSPYYVENDPGTPNRVENAGNEAQSAAPIAYLTQYSHWDNPYRVQVFRADNDTDDPMALGTLNYFQYVPPAGANGPQILHTVVQPGQPGAAGTQTGPQVDPATGVWLGPLNPAVPYNDANFFAYTVDPRAGMVNFSFPWSVLCYNSDHTPAPQKYDPNDVNKAITTSAEQKRYILLGDPLSTATYDTGPLNPASAKSPFDKNVFGTDPTKDKPRISIVAGSERVFGPDQRPGPHYGYRIQYTRVSASAGFVGPNQYKINYNDVLNANPTASPLVRAGYIEFDSIPDAGDANPNTSLENLIPPTKPGQPDLVYRPHSLPLLRAVVDASGALMSAPAAPVEVTYSFQMNRPNDVVKADYLTRELMNIAATVRYYDPRSGRPQEISLTSQVKVRNLQR